MRYAHSRTVRALALPVVMFLGAAGAGCATNTGSQGAGGGGSSAGGGGSGGAVVGGGGNAGSGGATCTAMTEICDGVDNDCDGMVDNVPGLVGGCQCDDGATQECYSGEEGTAGVGACVKGSQTCANGAWGACTGETVPKDEACNLQDDDCNGQVDDMGQTMCGVGACLVMVDKCVNGVMQPCTPGTPSIEVCDGVDNNCNQVTDEADPNLNMACDSGLLGECKAGKQTCAAGVLTCAADKMPLTESCNGKDDDCNGSIDDQILGTGGACDTGAPGVCGAGTISCKDVGGGNFTVDCFSEVEASPEICDGLDNDCDGAVDQGDPEGGGACDTGLLGECQTGTYHCVQGGVTCVQNTQAGAETCNGKDDNCDGQSDEGNPGGGQSCGCPAQGQGMTSCVNGALLCSGGAGPTVYFAEDFKNNSKGWTLDAGWGIGPATASSGHNYGFPDPSTDHTPTPDNGIAGAYIGGNVPVSASPPRYLLSPVIDMTGKAGTIILTYFRVLNSDYPGYMDSTLEVKNAAGTWVTLFSVPQFTPISESAWTKYTHDVSAHAANNPNFQMRWGWSTTGSALTYVVSGWNVDDVSLGNAACP